MDAFEVLIVKLGGAEDDYRDYGHRAYSYLLDALGEKRTKRRGREKLASIKYYNTKTKKSKETSPKERRFQDMSCK